MNNIVMRTECSIAAIAALVRVLVVTAAEAHGHPRLGAQERPRSVRVEGTMLPARAPPAHDASQSDALTLPKSSAISSAV